MKILIFVVIPKKKHDQSKYNSHLEHDCSSMLTICTCTSINYEEVQVSRTSVHFQPSIVIEKFCTYLCPTCEQSYSKAFYL